MAYKMGISDWSSDVCSSDLLIAVASDRAIPPVAAKPDGEPIPYGIPGGGGFFGGCRHVRRPARHTAIRVGPGPGSAAADPRLDPAVAARRRHRLAGRCRLVRTAARLGRDRKSTRLNSSH